MEKLLEAAWVGPQLGVVSVNHSGRVNNVSWVDGDKYGTCSLALAGSVLNKETMAFCQHFSLHDPCKF